MTNTPNYGEGTRERLNDAAKKIARTALRTNRRYRHVLDMLRGVDTTHFSRDPDLRDRWALDVAPQVRVIYAGGVGDEVFDSAICDIARVFAERHPALKRKR